MDIRGERLAHGRGRLRGGLGAHHVGVAGREAHEDLAHLRGGLARPVDDLGEAPPLGAIVIDPRPLEVLDRGEALLGPGLAQALDRLVAIDLTGEQGVEDRGLGSAARLALAHP